jgi:hypothetical protein
MGTLTFSGQEITDAVRAGGVEGDGLSSDSSIGVYDGHTNLLTNGGGETNTTNWQNDGGSKTVTVTRDTVEFKFGVASIKGVVGSGAGTAIMTGRTATGLALASLSKARVGVWVKGTGSIRVATRIIHTDATIVDGTATNVTLSGTWQEIVPAAATVTSGKTGDRIAVKIDDQGTSGYTVYVDGARAHAGQVVYPYKHTDGAALSRTDGLVTCPATLFSTSQFWVAYRVRAGFNSGEPHASFPGLFRWQQTSGSSNRVVVYFLNNNWIIESDAGGTVDSVPAPSTFNRGDMLTVIAACTLTDIKISVNGAAFVVESRTGGVPLVDETTFRIGSADQPGDCDIKWFACGVGTLSDADAALIHGFGNTDPAFISFPSGARVTGVWPASSTAFQAIQKPAKLVVCDYAGIDPSASEREALWAAAKVGDVRSYRKGQLVYIDLELFGETNAMDPQFITIKAARPGSSSVFQTWTRAVLNRLSAGRYRVRVTLDTVGIWTFRVETTTPWVTAEEWNIHVYESNF